MKHIKRIFEAKGSGKVILIKADYNDADYVTSRNRITDDQIEEIMPMIDALKKWNRLRQIVRPDGSFHSQDYNCVGDVKDDDDLSPSEMYGDVPGFDLFSGFVPHGEYGIHTIESVEILSNPIKLY